MYLAGLSGIPVRVGGIVQEFNEIDSALDNALRTGQALRPNGTPYTATQFMGGWLLDGCPLNVILGRGWIPGQQEALRAAGLTQCLPALPSPPPVTQIAAPDWKPPIASASGKAILPTGVATPSITVMPSGYQQITPPETASELQETPDWFPYLALGIGALVLLFASRRR